MGSIHIYHHKLTLFIFCILLFSCGNKETNTAYLNVKDSTRKKFEQHCLLCDSLKTIHPYTAITECNQALKVGKPWAGKKEIVLVLCNQAKAFSFVGNYTEQLRVMLEALRLVEDADDVPLKISVYKQLAVCNYYLGNYKEAILIDEKILEVAKSTHDTVLIAGSLNNIGDAYKNIGEPKDEIKYYQEAIYFILDKNGQPRNLEYYCTILGNMGVAYKKMGQYQEALAYCRKSLYPRKNLPHKGYYAGSLKDIGVIYEEMGNLDSAIYYQKWCILEVKDIDGKEWLSEAYDHLRNIYVKLGQWDSAYKYQELYINIENDRTNTASIREQGLLQARYEHEKALEKERIIYETAERVKEGQISMQRFLLYILFIIILFVIALFLFSSSKNIKMRRLNAELGGKNVSIATLMKEIHHRVKNNLQIISSILNIQQRNQNNPELKEAFKDAN